MDRAELVAEHVNDLIGKLEVKTARRKKHHAADPPMLAFQAAGAVDAFHLVGLLSDTQRAETMERISWAMRDPAERPGSRIRPPVDPPTLSSPIATEILSVAAGPWQLDRGSTILSVETYTDAVIVRWLVNEEGFASLDDGDGFFDLADDLDHRFLLQRARTSSDGKVIRGEYLFTPAIHPGATTLTLRGSRGSILRLETG